jgi:hypothetical protein
MITMNSINFNRIIMMSSPPQLSNITILPITHPCCWKITLEDAKNHPNTEEVVFTIQGALSMKDLPPIVAAM